MLTREELIAIEDAICSDKANLQKLLDNKYSSIDKHKARLHLNFLSDLKKKISDMIDETEESK